MTIDFSDARIRHLSSAIGIISVILSIAWFVAEPVMAQYIKEHIVAENVQLKKAVEDANRNVEKTRQEIRDLQRRSDKAEIQRENIQQLQQRLLDELIKSNHRSGQ